jgi:hypothetical protein
MSDQRSARTERRGHIIDARGRRVSQLDPVALHLLHRHDAIGSDDLRAIAAAIDPLEVRRRPWAALVTPIWIVLWYAAFFGYFQIFNRWRGWDPVLIGFAVLYFVYPIAWLYIGFRRARRVRWERIRRIMLEHRHCPHCGYDIRGLAVDGRDGATVCPECGCAWMVSDEATERRSNEGGHSRG